jgi:hypothetical protein
MFIAIYLEPLEPELQQIPQPLADARNGNVAEP